MTPSDITPEVAAVLQLLNVPVQQALQGQETLRKQVEELSRELIVQKEHIHVMSEDMQQLETRLDAMEDKIIKKQTEASNRIIAIQAAILLSILGAAMTYVFTFVHH